MKNGRATILIVDDTPDNLSLLSGLLKSEYRLRIANNGTRALQALSVGALPDLILLDIMMPELDGFEVCRRLKEDPKTVNIPVIFLSAKTQTSDEIQGLQMGAVDYITKPFNPPLVLARIKTHLDLAAIQMEVIRLRQENQRLRDELARVQ
ncbi:response regulator [Magnetococcales bacterium HHB-1]